MKSIKKISSKFYLVSIYCLLYIPILILVTYSFNTAKYSLQWHGFSLQWYQELFQDAGLWEAFGHSIILGLSAALISTFLSVLCCIHLFIFKNKKQQGLHLMLLLLIIIPELVLGIALLIFFNIFGINLGFFSLLIGHVTFCLPFVIYTLNNHFQHLDINIYFSALDLGASRRQTLLKIFLPILFPGILSAVLLAFTLSFDDVIISYFIAGPEYNILPLLIYSLVRTGVTPELNALCSITFLLSMGLVISSHLLTRKKI